jgi:hypothetical protein
MFGYVFQENWYTVFFRYSFLVCRSRHDAVAKQDPDMLVLTHDYVE